MKLRQKGPCGSQGEFANHCAREALLVIKWTSHKKNRAPAIRIKTDKIKRDKALMKITPFLICPSAICVCPSASGLRRFGPCRSWCFPKTGLNSPQKPSLKISGELSKLSYLIYLQSK
ncbi:hypothetical protein PoB_000433000 [Plakobranchus ocellatus]|uniref:Uncharacterized protein n=1 Tax=Plakobranchus ocellatus TaxID=259542 RepID=A0AAV3Y456_9GAST|nr:hypothetical protein PoB_000433000 [Plakobranchus ocellatus]